MKKNFIIFVAAMSILSFVGCDLDKEYNPPSYVTLETGPAEVGVDLNSSTTHPVTIYTANVVDSDRTFNIEVRSNSSLTSEAYSVPATVTVPGGTNEATFNVDISDVDISPEGETLILTIASGEEYLVGNTLTLNISQLCDPEFRINFAFDGYASEISWELMDAEGNIVFEGGSFSNGTGTASIMRCINPGEYTFTVRDSYGDGLTYPNVGSVTLLYGGEEIAVIPGNFGSESSITFNTEGGTSDGDEDEDEEEGDGSEG